MRGRGGRRGAPGRVAAAVAVALAVAGCGDRTDRRAAAIYVAPEAGEFELTVRGEGAVLPVRQSVVTCPGGFWARVKSVAEPGTAVTTGDVVAEFDLSDWESQIQNRRRQHKNRLLQVDRLEAQQAQARAVGETRLTEKRLALDTAQEKLKILLAGPPRDKVAAQELMLRAGLAYERDQDRKLSLEERLRARGFTSELSYLDTLGELEKARRRRDAARAELARLKGGPRPEDRTRLRAEKALIALETGQVEKTHEDDLALQALQRKEKALEVKAAEGRIARLQRRLAGGSLQATSSGVVLHSLQGQVGRPVTLGTMAWGGLELLRVIGTDQYQIEARVSERDIDEVEPGAAARVEFPALPGVVAAGSVTRIGKIAVPALASDPEGPKVFEVTVLLAGEPPAGMRPNLTARVAFARAGPGAAWRLPAEAIRRDAAGPYLVLRGGARRRVEVVAEDDRFAYCGGEVPPGAVLLAGPGARS